MQCLPLSGRHRTLDYPTAAMEAKIYQNNKLPTAQYLHIYYRNLIWASNAILELYGKALTLY